MKRIAVFCGARSGNDPGHVHLAERLGRALVARGIALVYGGGNVGLMGALAEAVLSAGGHVTGVIPSSMVQRELAHRGIQDLREVESMHERKKLMSDLSDGFIALPGAFGTLDELFEALTWAQLGIHGKPCGLLNEGYFDALIALVDGFLSEGFLASETRALLLVERDPDALLDRFAAYRPPAAPPMPRVVP